VWVSKKGGLKKGAGCGTIATDYMSGKTQRRERGTWKMHTVTKEILSLDSLEKLILRSGLKLGDEVVVHLKLQGLEITTNPARALWGSLRSSKDASQLKLEAYEEMGDLLDVKVSG
jgi:hypothetical protein